MSADSVIQPEIFQGFAKGHRFGLWVKPKDKPVLAAVLAIQTTGQENALSRRYLVKAASRFANLGIATLLFDPYGTGDSAGNSADIRLNDWRSDLMRASHLIRTRFEVPFFLWGLRLGSLLAAELLITQSDTTAGVLMWAPLAHGRTWIDSIMIPDLPGQAMKQPIGCKQAHIPKLEAQTLTGLNSEILDEGETESNVRTLITRGGEYRSSFLEEIRLLSLNPIRNHHPESANAEVAQLTISKNNDNDHLASHSNNEPPELDMISKAWEAAGFRVYAKAVHGDSFWLHPGANEPLALYEASEAWLSRSMAQVK